MTTTTTSTAAPPLLTLADTATARGDHDLARDLQHLDLWVAGPIEVISDGSGGSRVLVRIGTVTLTRYGCMELRETIESGDIRTENRRDYAPVGNGKWVELDDCAAMWAAS